jgi:hypothetical protein
MPRGAQEFVAAGCEAMSNIPHRSVRKILSNKNRPKEIFSHFILALPESRGALLSLNGCDNVSGGLINQPKFVSRKVQNK